MISYIIGFLIVCGFLGVFLAFILAPIVILANKSRIKQMKEKIEAFKSATFKTADEKEIAKEILKKELINIKAGITGDNAAISTASDILNSL